MAWCRWGCRPLSAHLFRKLDRAAAPPSASAIGHRRYPGARRGSRRTAGCRLVAIHEDLGGAWTLERMAERACLSRTAFANTFRDVVGQTPVDYLTTWRIALAQSRLRRNESIKSLTEALGYTTPSALSRAFTAKVGQSPREWLSQRSG